MQRVVVTGIGLVTPLGVDVPTFSKRMFAGESGVRNVRGSLVASNFPVPYAALVDAEHMPTPTGLGPRAANHYWLFSAAAAEQALASLPKSARVDGLVYGTAEGVSFEVVQESLKILRQSKSIGSFDWDLAKTETSLDIINEMLVARGQTALDPERLIAVNGACASGNQTIGLAFQRIRRGDWTRALAGGVDARCTPSSLMNFHMLSALMSQDVAPETASRPFAKDRGGFVRGEGAAVLMLESLDAAVARGATIYGEILGCGNTSDAYRLTDPREDSSSVVRAIQEALRDAKLDTTQIDYVSAHGTSTPMNDKLETQALKMVFGERAYKIPVSSLKSQIGHATVAAGAIEAIACLLMMKEGRLAPTINLHAPDPECDLDYVPNVAREAKPRRVLNNSFGFGGQNSCLILGEAPSP